MLDEHFSDDVGGARGDDRHGQRADHRSNPGRPFITLPTPIAVVVARSPGAPIRQALRSRPARLSGKRNPVDFRKAAQHLQLDSADCGYVDDRDRNKPAALD